jgi:hypothetical protein
VHALVVGGTGMLAGVCRTLAERGYDVSVVARGRGGLLDPLLAAGGSARGGSCSPLAHAAPARARHNEL